MGREGFEPSKAEPADLQSAPFDRFGTYPFPGRSKLRVSWSANKWRYNSVLQGKVTGYIASIALMAKIRQAQSAGLATKDLPVTIEKTTDHAAILFFSDNHLLIGIVPGGLRFHFIGE